MAFQKTPASLKLPIELRKKNPKILEFLKTFVILPQAEKDYENIILRQRL